MKVAPDGAQTTVFSAAAIVRVDAAGDLFVSAGPGVVEIAPDGTQREVYEGDLDDFAVDSAGSVFIADSIDHRVVKVSSQGAQTSVYSGVPTAVAVDLEGDLSIGDDTLVPAVVERPAVP